MIEKTDLNIENVRKYLKRLKLSRINEHLESILSDAKSGRFTATETLAYALKKEVECREQKRICLSLTLAHFPRICTLDGFDFKLQEGVSEAEIRELARLEWIDQKKNLLFLGPPGVGKTHLAIAMGRIAIEKGCTTTFISAVELAKQLETAYQDGTLEKKLLQLSKPRLLIIDEIGYLPVKPQTAYLFFQLISMRYEKSCMVLTSNRPVSEWGIVFGDQTATTAILDRVLHHSEVITIRGDSYRLLEKRRSGLLRSHNGSTKT